MNRPSTNPALPVQRARPLIDPALAPLLAQAGAQQALEAKAKLALRQRLLGRVAKASQAESVLFTTRRQRTLRQAWGPGVIGQTLYQARRPDALRPGEPLRTALIELAPGTAWDGGLAAGDPGLHREWLLLSGSATLDRPQDGPQAGDAPLSQRDYHVTPAGQAAARWVSAAGASLFLRESRLVAHAGDQAFTVRDADAGWPDFAPGVQRRVLWQRDGQAAVLYFAQAGAQVPPHRHGHDEECLMLQGELFLDDLLLQAGDYQLAPAGTGHHTTHTDTGVVVYAHGDLDYQFIG